MSDYSYPMRNAPTFKLQRPRDFLVPKTGTYHGKLDTVRHSPTSNSLRLIFEIPPQASLNKTYDVARTFDLDDTGALTSFLNNWLGSKLPSLLQPDGSISLQALETLEDHPALLSIGMIVNSNHSEAFRHIDKIGPAPTTPSSTRVSSSPPGHQPFQGAAGKNSVRKRRPKFSSADQDDSSTPW